MKRVLGIVASPRKLGNSEILMKAAMVASGADELDMIRLTELDLKPCQACYRCLPKDKPCVLKDDLEFVLDNIRKADAVVIAAPCYVFGPNATIKLLQDRMLSTGSKIEHYDGKPCITITAYGRPGVEGYAESALNVTAHFLGLKLVDSASFLGANPASVLEDPANLQRVQSMGRALFDPDYRRTPRPYECPVCWSDVLKYNGKEVICPLCGSKGELVLDGAEVKMHFPAQPHRFSLEGKYEHMEEFLPAKKAEFMEKREQYKELQKPYREIGKWITPEEK
jgi:multimeric flavodoxin WrbA